jgi:hypothetical protein
MPAGAATPGTGTDSKPFPEPVKYVFAVMIPVCRHQSDDETTNIAK